VTTDRFRVSVSLCFLTVLAVAAAVAGEDAPRKPSVADSPISHQAGTKYQRDLDAANRDFESKVQQLRRDYEAKVAAARKAYVAGLRAGQAEEAKKGRLEVALAVKEAISKAEAEGGPAWPQQVLPAPSGENAPAAAVAAPANPGRLQKFSAAKGKLFDLSSEAKINEFWTLPEDKKKWQIINGGVDQNGRDIFLNSKFKFSGDCTVQVALETVHSSQTIDIELFGEKVVCPRSGFDRKQLYVVTIQRKGDKLLTKVNDKADTVVIKQAELATPTSLQIRTQQGEMTIKGVRITANELQLDPGESIFKP
jgi:hypothetical protein